MHFYKLSELFSVDKLSDEVLCIFKHFLFDNKDAKPPSWIDKILSTVADTSNIDLCSFGADSEPKDWANSQKHPSAEVAKWAAMFKDECNLLKDMGVYILVLYFSIPAGNKICHYKAVLCNKLDNKNWLTCYKVHFIFKGYKQQYGQDYTSTTSPTACIELWQPCLLIFYIKLC